MSVQASVFHRMNADQQIALLNSILENSIEYSIIAVDLDLNIIVWNEGARLIYRYTTDEVIGKNISIIQDPEDIKSNKIKKMFEIAEQEGKWQGEVTRVAKNGNQFESFISITPLKNLKEKITGFLIIARDLSKSQQIARLLLKHVESEETLQSKNKELEELTHQAKEANRLKGEFIANVSHELRTPLTVIIGFAEILHDGMVDPKSSNYKEFLSDILSNARHLLLLIDDILDLEKMNSGKLDLNLEKVNVKQLVKATENAFSALIKQKNIQFSVKIDPSLNEIYFDAGRLKQIFYNYVSNAIKFTPDNGKIYLSILPFQDDKFRIEVEDTGIGIKSEDLEKLFTKFQQLDASRAKKYPGTGLGLALTKQIVELLDGEVGVKSIHGKGSIFYAILPRTLKV